MTVAHTIQQTARRGSRSIIIGSPPISYIVHALASRPGKIGYLIPDQSFLLQPLQKRIIHPAAERFIRPESGSVCPCGQGCSFFVSHFVAGKMLAPQGDQRLQCCVQIVQSLSRHGKNDVQTDMLKSFRPQQIISLRHLRRGMDPT